jgi:hypothetical protein
VPIKLSIKANRLADPNNILKSLLHHSSGSSLFSISYHTRPPCLVDTVVRSADALLAGLARARVDTDVAVSAVRGYGC